MPRTAAERLLDEFLQRIAALNEDSRFLARVEKAIVFGSYLSGGDQLGDVDVAVHLVPRSSDLKKHREANYRRVAEEEQKGRRFRSFLYQAFSWEQETMLFLRNRHRGLSLQHYGSIREAVEAPHFLILPVLIHGGFPADSAPCECMSKRLALRNSGSCRPLPS
jgi:hypothetical protein